MQSEQGTIIVHWVRDLPTDLVRVDDGHFRDALRQIHYVQWIGRWCKVSQEVMDDLGGFPGSIGASIADGNLAVVFERDVR